MSTTAVIPAHGRLDDLRRAIRSVLAQTTPVSEVIVVDDASPTPLGPELASFGSMVRVLRHERNRGAAAARNTGVAEATTDWIAFLDSDDEWLPDKQSRQQAALHAAQASSGVTGFILRGEGRDRVVPLPAEPVTFDRMLRGCHVSPGSTWMVRRDRFAALGGFDPSLPRLEDWDLLLRDTQQQPLCALPDPVVVVHGHAGPPAALVHQALGQIARRWLPELAPRQRRVLRGGLHLEVAAAHARAGQRLQTAASLAAGVMTDPWQAADLVRRAAQRLR